MIHNAFWDGIFRFFLEFSHTIIIVPLLLIGYFKVNKKLFFNAFCLLLFSEIVNVALKVTFQVPLAPFLHKEGFAFPSGHMQAATVLYGWLFKFINNICVRLSIVIILTGIALGLLYFGYHNSIDILAAIVTGLLLITVYSLGLNKFSQKNIYLLLLFLSTVLMGYIQLRYEIKAYVAMMYGILVAILGLGLACLAPDHYK